MPNEKRPGGDDKAWVDHERTEPKNSFDGDGEFGQDGNREREAAMGRQHPSGSSLKEATEQAGGKGGDPDRG